MSHRDKGALRRITIRSLVLLGLLVAGSPIAGCSRKKQNQSPLKVYVVLTNPATPKFCPPEAAHSDTMAFGADCLWSFLSDSIDGRLYLIAALRTDKEPFEGGAALRENELFRIVISSIDPNSAAAGEGEILIATKVDVDLGVERPGTGWKVIEVASGKSLSEQHIFPPGTYTFRVIGPALSSPAASQPAER